MSTNVLGFMPRATPNITNASTILIAFMPASFMFTFIASRCAMTSGLMICNRFSCFSQAKVVFFVDMTNRPDTIVPGLFWLFVEIYFLKSFALAGVFLSVFVFATFAGAAFLGATPMRLSSYTRHWMVPLIAFPRSSLQSRVNLPW